MASLDEIRAERLRKLALLRERGIDPYPAESSRTHEIGEAIENFAKLTKLKKVTLAGRILAIRGQGALVFFDFTDGTGNFQGLLKKGEIDEEEQQLFSDAVDVGDFLEISGALFETKRKEKTILVTSWRMLAKSLRPLPDKWHGLQDVEERFRRRYLDLLMSPEVKERFLVRSQLINEIRNFYNRNGYIEVETPVLQTLAGGATAAPFITHHNALDIDFNLRIAQELSLKKLVIGGLNRVYEIGRVFRNEGVDVTHNPEFTMLESQEAYSDAAGQREFIEKLFKYLVKKVHGYTQLKYDGKEIDFSKKFAVISFFDILRRYALIPNPESAGRKELELKASQFGLVIADSDAPEKIMDSIYKKVGRPKLIQPTFIVDYPAASNPFAKRKSDDPKFVDRFQLIVGGLEMVNAFSELNDPEEQRERYMEQDKKGKAGEREISPSDQEYVEAMEYGMPPNGGIGIGIDRLVMLFTNTHNIKEVILFPTLKPRNEEN